MPDRIELRSGACFWLARLQRLITFAAAILLLALTTPWPWKLGALAALSVAHALAVRHNRRHHSSSALQLQVDGTLRQKQPGIELDGIVESAWVSRWLCVIHWTATGERFQRHNLICASNNRPEDFRRLLVLLRLGPKSSAGALSW